MSLESGESGNKRDKVTIRDVAKAAGLSKTTVGDALQGKGRVSERTRKKVQQIAKKLGYQKNSFASVLSHSKKADHSAYKGTIAYLNIHKYREGFRISFHLAKMLEGAKKRCQELGYQLEEVWVFEPGISGERLSDILLSRGIEGLLLYGKPLLSSKMMGWPLKWENFACATVGGGSASFFNMHYVGVDYSEMASLGMKKLIQAGYEKIGLVIDEKSSGGVQRQVQNAYYGEQIAQFSGYAQIPILKMKVPMDKRSALERAKEIEIHFMKWYEKYQPDAILSNIWVVLNWLKKRNRNRKRARPTKVVVFPYSNYVKERKATGIRFPSEEMGKAAIEFIVEQFYHGERGIPKSPKKLLYPGIWVEK